MTFVAIMKPLPGADKKRLSRRANWKFPDKIKLLAEYWLPHKEIACICILETNDISTIMEAYYDWFDVFDTTIVPALSGQDGLGIAKKFEHA